MDQLIVLQIVASGFGLYIFTLSIWRLYFSRISHIPGPRLAALTYYYQSYWDVYPHSGQFMFRCIDLHKQYGPIIRIGPDEIHIDDPSFYSTCYPTSITRRRDKSPTFFGWFQGTGEFSDGSSFSTLPHDLHRMRRSGIAPFFSKQMVRDLEPRIRAKVLLLREALLKHVGKSVNMNDAMSALTMDVISEYSFGHPIGALERADLAQPYTEALREAMKIHPIARTFPTLVRNMIYIPDRIVESLNPVLAVANSFQKTVGDLTKVAFAEAKSERTNEVRTVLHAIINNPDVPEEEKAYKRVVAEGMILFGAGTETTGRTLATTLLHILLNPETHSRLLAELQPLVPSYQSTLPPASQLEALPYLTAVISEGLRISHGVAGRMSRIAPDETLTYPNGRSGPVAIPAGATFSQSNYMVHMNEGIYPEPFKFRPERFILSANPTSEEIKAVAEAKAYLVPFGRGTRACVGINLAYSELYLTLSAVIAGLKLEVAEGTTEKDAKITEEYFVGALGVGEKGIAIKVLGTR